jgi:hypothetical protein
LTETETKINDVAQANGYEALFQSFSKQNWFAGRYGNGMLMIITRKDIDYPQEKPALETLKNGTNKPQFMNSNNTKPVIIFDVNETLLDGAVKKHQ